MKLLHILLIGILLLCGSGIASAANDTDDADKDSMLIGGFVDMGKVKDGAGEFWKTSGDAGYILLGIGFAVWVLIILGAAFLGSASHAIGNETKNADIAQSGMTRMHRVAIATLAPPLLIILLYVGTELI